MKINLNSLKGFFQQKKKAEPTYLLLTDESFHYRDKAKYKCKLKDIPQTLLWKTLLKKNHALKRELKITWEWQGPQ